MYAIRVVGPSGLVQYVNTAPLPFLTGRFADALTFENEDEAQYIVDEMPLSVRYGRIVHVTNIDEDIA